MKRQSVRQYQKSVMTGQRRFTAAPLLAFIVTFLLLTGGAAYHAAHRPYSPPPFDASAVSGEPSPPEESEYVAVGTEETFTVNLASNWTRREDGTLPVWFANPPDSRVYLLFRMERPSDGAVLYESGIVEPGAYVEQLAPLQPLSAETLEVWVNIYSFDPETYHSMGTFHLSGVLT